jgi:hypothetical protein
MRQTRSNKAASASFEYLHSYGALHAGAFHHNRRSRFTEAPKLRLQSTPQMIHGIIYHDFIKPLVVNRARAASRWTTDSYTRQAHERSGAAPVSPLEGKWRAHFG